MTKAIKFSIIIPCYNMEKYILKTLNFLKTNNFDINFEILIIDDFSSDKSVMLIKEYLKITNLNIKLIELNKNKGVSNARNIGIENSSGEYLIFLDGDDYLDTNILKYCEKLIKKEKIDFIGFDYELLFSDYDKIKINNRKEKKIEQYTQKEIVKKYLSRKITLSIGSFIVRKELLNNMNIKFNSDIYYSEDQQFIIKVLIASKKILYIKEVYLYYRQHEESVMGKKIDIKRLTSIDALIDLRKFLPNEFEELYYYYFSTMIIGLLNNIVKVGVVDERVMLFNLEKYRKTILIKSLRRNLLNPNRYTLPIFISSINYRYYIKLLQLILNIKRRK